MFIVSIGHPSSLGLEAGHAGQRFQVGVLKRLKPGGECGLFHQARSGALRQGLCQVTPSIGGGARPGNETITLLHQPTVGSQLARHARVQPAGRFLSAVQGAHQNDSSTALATIWGLTAMSG